MTAPTKRVERLERAHSRLRRVMLWLLFLLAVAVAAGIVLQFGLPLEPLD